MEVCHDQCGSPRRPAAPQPAGGLDDRAAGVDIAAGEALVEMIKPLAKATSRPGVIGGSGWIWRAV